MTNADELLIEKFDRIIEENFENPAFSVENACKELGISYSKLYRLLKEKFNLSTSLYIRRKKLQKAKELLINSNLKIAEVSYRVGIDSPQNFSKYFINEFNLSPTEFRKSLQNPEDDNIVDIPFQEPVSESQNLPLKQRKYLFWGIGILLIIALFIYLSEILPETFKSDLSEEDINNKSIVILPFINLGDSTTAYLTEGITEQIRSSLASSNEFKVISTFSSNKYSHAKKNINQIARELGVHFILKGTVLQNDSLLNVNIELYNEKDNQVIWTKKYNGHAKEIFGFLDKTSERISGELNNKLNSRFTHQLRRAPQTNLPAYREYLQGMELLHHRNKEKLEAALIKFNRAIELDPNLAEAYAEKANAHFLLADGAYTDIDTAMTLAEQNAQKAIRIDYTNAIAYAVLGNIFKDQNKWEESDKAYLTALKYEPNNTLINYWYSLILRSTGRLDKAVEFSTKAIILDPLHPVISAGHILNCVYGNRPELAEKTIRDGELLFNDLWAYHSSRGLFYMVKKDYSSALRDFHRASELNPNVRVIRNASVYCQVKLGQRKEVENYLKSLADIPENYIIIAMIYVALDDREHALYYLEKSAALDTIPTDMKVLPMLNSLHGDKRFEAILKKFGLDGPLVYP